MACRGICDRYKAKKPANSNIGRYASGQRRCNPCEIFVNCVSIRCPCCGTKLRTKPRNLSCKQKYITDMIENE